VADAAESLLRDAVERVAELTEECLRNRPGGRGLATAASGADNPMAAATAVREWLAETALRVRAAGGLADRGGAEPHRDQAQATTREAVLVMVAALAGAPEDVSGPLADRAPVTQAYASLTPAAAATVEPVRADLRLRAAGVLETAREHRIQAIRVLCTKPGTGLYEAAQAVRRAG
jgi:hypothetical protein